MTEIAEPIPTVTYSRTGPPGVVWIKRPPAVYVGIWAVLLLMIGFLFGAVVFGPGDSTAKELTEEQKATPILTQQLWPATITLRVVSEQQFAAERGDPRIIAFTRATLAPCVITIPDTWKIIFMSRDRVADFVDPTNGKTLAHEILHCYRGNWHPAWW